jgi:hypothetical protein
MNSQYITPEEKCDLAEREKIKPFRCKKCSKERPATKFNTRPEDFNPGWILAHLDGEEIHFCSHLCYRNYGHQDQTANVGFYPKELLSKSFIQKLLTPSDKRECI